MKLIDLHLYHAEPAYLYTGEFSNRLQYVQRRTLEVGTFTMTPVNSTGGPSLGSGLGFLYTKLTMDQPQINQEAYIMQTIAQMNAAINAGN